MQLLAKCVFLGLLSRCCSHVFIENGGCFDVFCCFFWRGGGGGVLHE